MEHVIILSKPVGQTPLQALDKLREDRAELAGVKFSYAGRLDPMAEGLLLVLVGDENNNRERYLGLDKEYEVEVLFGVETDTYDILGIVNPDRILSLVANPPRVPRADKDNVLAGLHKFIGKVNLPYPPFSSKPVNGKTLFEWARSGKIGEIEIPKQDAEIKNIELIKSYTIKRSKLQTYISDSIKKVSGDFRQDQILKSWEQFFANAEATTEFNVAKIKVACTSGAYMRSIAHELGHALSTSAIALTIKRTRVGEYTL